MTKTSLIEFPCLFPIKIIGDQSPLFVEEIKQIVLKHFSKFDDNDLTYKLSEKSNYLAITVRVFAEDQNMLDDFYQEVTKHPNVKMVL